MARNFQLSVLRGPLVNMPALGDGEFYFATDVFQLYVGLNGDSLKIGETMAVQIQDGITTNKLAVATDGSIPTSLSGLGKTPIAKTGSLTSVATTAGQVILTYTVTAAKTLFLEYLDIQARLTTPSATAAVLGLVTISIAGVASYSGTFVNPTTSDCGSQTIRISFGGEPLPLAAGTVILIAVTPAAATSTLWIGNLIGYEK